MGGWMRRLDFKDLRRKEIFYWSILLFNLTLFFFNIFSGNLYFLANAVAVGLMIYAIEIYYRLER